jgi:ATP-dependent DNA helicase RecQ
VKFCQLQTCRRQYLMHYFNEPFADHCGSCDVCLTEFKRFDGTILAQKALSAVVRLNQRFGITYVIDFLRGSKSEKIRPEHKELKTYGIGADVSKADWQRYIGQLVLQGYLQVTDDDYHTIKLTPTSDTVLKGKQKIEFTLAEDIEVATEIQVPVYEAGLLQDLKTIRFNLAMNENVPAYIIVSDATLLEIATYLPQTPNELGCISGFGEVKLVRYGDAFLQATLAYCHQHNLTSKIDAKQGKTPSRTPKASTATRPFAGKTQRESFEMYRAGISITEIASMRNLSPTTVESHLCSFIETGEMKVSELVSAEKMAFIQDAVANYGAERLAPLKEALGDDYSYAEIKAVVSWMKKEV